MTENKPLPELFEQELNKRLIFSKETDSDDRVKARIALERLYESQGRLAPAIIWCRSIYQLVTLPSLLVGVMHSDNWQLISANLADREQDQKWKQQWNEAWPTVWHYGGQQLLAGMRTHSRIQHQYDHLETALMTQVKNEFASWLGSGKIKRFEDKLSRQAIYRQYWAMSIWSQNFVTARVRNLMDELDIALRKDGNRRRTEWKHFLPYQDQLRIRYNAASTSIASIVAGMGAEPVAQLRWATWLPFGFAQPSVCYMFLNHVVGKELGEYAEELDIWNQLGETVMGAICLENVAFVCEKPLQFHIDQGGRLHNADGQALLFADGFAAHAWHGIIVDERVITDPESITIKEIESTANIEMRRVLIERYGQPRYLMDSGAIVVHEDDFGVLYRKRIEGDEPLVMVKVVNSTPEPDGTYKDYFLRVPPDMQTAREAVAWTFGFDSDDYTPSRET